LHLGRSGIDGAGARPEECGRERAGLAGRRVDLLELLTGDHLLAPRAEDLERGLVEALLKLGVRELRDRRRRPRRLALVQGGQHTKARVALDLERGIHLPELRAHDGIVDERPATALQLLRRVDQLVERDRIARDATERVAAALVTERGLRDLPALAEPADQV